jgi:hypothetical protein
MLSLCFFFSAVVEYLKEKSIRVVDRADLLNSIHFNVNVNVANEPKRREEADRAQHEEKDVATD